MEKEKGVLLYSLETYMGMIFMSLLMRLSRLLHKNHHLHFPFKNFIFFINLLESCKESLTVPKEKKYYIIILSLLEMLMAGYEGQRNYNVALVILQ